MNKLQEALDGHAEHPHPKAVQDVTKVLVAHGNSPDWQLGVLRTIIEAIENDAARERKTRAACARNTND